MHIEMKAAVPMMRIVPPGFRQIELEGAMAMVDVTFDYKPATPDSPEEPGDVAQVDIVSVKLQASVALHDTGDVATLVLSRGTEMLQLLADREIQRIGEKALQETLRNEGRAG